MWGHAAPCACGLCTAFPRLFALVAAGSNAPGFVPWAADKVRLLEAEVRDELQRRGAPASLFQGGVPAPAAGEPSAGGKREGEGTATAPPPSEPATAAESLLQTTAKGMPSI